MSYEQIKEAMRLNKGLNSTRVLYICIAGIPLGFGILLMVFGGDVADIGHGLVILGIFLAALCLILYPIVYFGIRQQFIDGKIDKYGNRLTVNKQPTVQAAPSRQQRTVAQQPARQVSNSRTTSPSHSTESTGIDVEDVLDNPLSKVAAAYAVGKASQEVTKAMGIQIPESNAEKYKRTVSVTGNSDGSRSMRKYQSVGGGSMHPNNTRKVAPGYEITTSLDGSEKLINTRTNRQVGRYDRMRNMTYVDSKAIGRGNLLTSLIK